MEAPKYSSVSAAFWEHLRGLGLQDFPCGLGSWVWSQGGTAWDVVGVCGLLGYHCLSLYAEQVPF